MTAPVNQPAPAYTPMGPLPGGIPIYGPVAFPYGVAGMPMASPAQWPAGLFARPTTLGLARPEISVLRAAASALICLANDDNSLHAPLSIWLSSYMGRLSK
jgi:hypothetical protein